MSNTLAIAYNALIILIIGVASLIFYEYNRKALYEDGVMNLSQTTEKVMNQVDACLESMEQTTVDALTTPGFVDHWLDYTENGDEVAGKKVKRALIEAYMYKSDIRRVAVFNADGDNICTGDNTTTIEEVQTKAAEIQARYSFKKSQSRVLMGEHTDFWYSESQIHVISEIKPIKDSEGNVVGYIEVQQNIFYLNQICDVKWGSTYLSTFVFFGDEDEILYEYMNKYNEGEGAEYFEELTQQYVKTQDNKNNVVATASSRYYECRTVIVLPYVVLFKSML